MRQLLVFIRKEFYHIARDPVTTLILIGLPIVMLFLFGFALTTEVKNTGFAVLSPEPGVLNRRLVQALNQNEYFTLKRWLRPGDNLDHAFRTGEVGLTVVFESGFDAKLRSGETPQIQLIADATDPNTATTLVQYASRILQQQVAAEFPDREAPLRLNSQIKLLYNPQMRGAYQFVPGVMGMILMLICAMMTSVSIAREKEKGTLELLLVSPMQPFYIILSKAIPYFVISILNLTSILLISYFVLKVPIQGSLLLLVLFSLVFIFVCLALGLLISTIVKTQAAALLASGMALMAPVILLSGMIFPVENMPWFLQVVSNIIPARWYIMGVKDIMIKGTDLSVVYREFVILSCMAVILMAISLRQFKNRLE